MKTKKIITFFGILITALVNLKCVERKPKGPTKQEMKIIKRYILKAKPKIKYPVKANLENKVFLLGYDLNKDRIHPNERVQVTWYWQCKKELKEYWRLFTHVENHTETLRLNMDNEGIIRRLYPPAFWKKGQIIKDVQEVLIPADWNSPIAVFYIGVWLGPHRLQVIEGPQDGTNRIEALRLKVVPRQPLLQISSLKISEKISIDGKLSENSWQKVSPVVLSKSDLPKTEVKILHDKENLYLGFECEDKDIKVKYKKDKESLEGDVISLILDPDGDNRNYFEIQVNPKGSVSDIFFNLPNEPRRTWSSGIKVKVKLDGSSNKSEDTDKKWTVEMGIPFKNVLYAPHIPPLSGDEWRINLSRRESSGNKKEEISWVDLKGKDRHSIFYFGKLKF
jgi:hypothetical protein